MTYALKDENIFLESFKNTVDLGRVMNYYRTFNASSDERDAS